MDYRLKYWMDQNLPKEKKEYSRDAVEILLQMLWKEAKSAEKSDEDERHREDQYGPMFF